MPGGVRLVGLSGDVTCHVKFLHSKPLADLWTCAYGSDRVKRRGAGREGYGGSW